MSPIAQKLIACCRGFLVERRLSWFFGRYLFNRNIGEYFCFLDRDLKKKKKEGRCETQQQKNFYGNLVIISET